MKYDKRLINKIHGSSDLIPKQMYKETALNLGDVTRINQKFMGGGMSQNYFAIPWFEYYFDIHNFGYMVEFGSQKGCLSTYFANFCGITEQMFFDTFEFKPEDSWYVRKYEGCGHWYEKLAEISPFVNYFHQDVFSEETKSHVVDNISQFKTFIFCDGGDKAREFNMYAPLLKVGDCIAVHDWGHEIGYHDISETLNKYNLVPDEPSVRSATQFHTWIMPFTRVK
jgi:hypothetical protein